MLHHGEFVVLSTQEKSPSIRNITGPALQQHTVLEIMAQL